jgi:rod shape determining protein RodA
MDHILIITAIIISLFGAINIYSATIGKNTASNYFILQSMWLVVGLVVMYIVTRIDYVIIASHISIVYWASVLLLIYTDFTAQVVNGASSWINIGSRGIQPSEFAKIAMLILVAKIIDEFEGDINNIKNLSKVLIYAAIPMILIVIQPDMGMTMITFFIMLGVVFIAGLNTKVILGGLGGLATMIILVWQTGLLPEYWKTRLTIFLHPESDELGAGLQLIQSQIGIGSGQIFGEGSKFGVQSGNGFVSQFVPESHTDFIFAVVGEKWGFIGAVFLMLLYIILVYRMVVIAKNSKDILGKIIVVGIMSSTVFSIFQNVGMTIGIMPITGITLPFMSYGGSSMLTNFISLGLVLNVGMRKKKINF